MDWQSHAGRSRYLARKEKETKRLRSLTRLKSLVRRTKVRCCKSAACLRRKRIRYMFGLLLAGPFTHCPRRLKRSSTLSQPIYATITWFGLTQTFSIGSRLMFQVKVRLFLRARMEIGQSPAEIMRPQIRAPSAA